MSGTHERQLRRIAVRATRFVLVGLFLGTLVAPLAALVPEGGRRAPVALPELVELAIGSTADLTGLSQREAALYGATLTVALVAVRIGVLLLVVGAAAVATAGLVLIASAETRHRRIVDVSAAVLLVGTLLLSGALAILPIDDGRAAPAWGMWLPLALALWVLLLHGPVADLDA